MHQGYDGSSSSGGNGGGVGGGGIGGVCGGAVGTSAAAQRHWLLRVAATATFVARARVAAIAESGGCSAAVAAAALQPQPQPQPQHILGRWQPPLDGSRQGSHCTPYYRMDVSLRTHSGEGEAGIESKVVHCHQPECSPWCFSSRCCLNLCQVLIAW